MCGALCDLHMAPTLHPHHRVRFVGGIQGTPPILGMGSPKKYVSEKVGTVGRGGVYEGKIKKKKGNNVTVDRILRECKNSHFTPKNSPSLPF